MDHRPPEPEVRIVEPQHKRPLGRWLAPTANCAGHLRDGQHALAALCAHRKRDNATLARAAEQLAAYDRAGTKWRLLQRATHGQMSMEVMRRGNAMAQAESAIAAVVRGKARNAAKLLKSARQTTGRQAKQPGLAMRDIGNLALLHGLALRAARNKRLALRAFRDAERLGPSWVAARAKLYTQRLKKRRRRRQPWPVVERSFGGPGDDAVNGVAHLRGGDMLLVGREAAPGDVGSQVALWRVDPSGRERWRVIYGAEGHEEGHAVAAVAGGDMVVVGETDDDGTGRDVLAVRFRSDRSVAWRHRIGGPGVDRAVSIIDRGSALWAAATTQAATPDADMRLLVISADGARRELVRLRGGGEDRAATIIRRGAGAVIAGSGRAVNKGPWQGRLIALDANKSVLWKKSIDNADGCTIESVIPARRNGLIVAGRTWVGGDSGRLFLAQVKSGGKIAWRVASKALVDAGIVGVVKTGRSHLAVLATGRKPGSLGAVWMLGFRGKRLRWKTPVATAGVKTAKAIVSHGRYGLVAVGTVADRGNGHHDGWFLRTGR